jgi:hypothetical protein
MESTPVRVRVNCAAKMSGGVALVCLAGAVLAPTVATAASSSPVHLVAQVSVLHPADGPGGGPGAGPGGGSDGSPGSNIAPSPLPHGSHDGGSGGSSPGSNIAPSPLPHGSHDGGSNASSTSSDSSTAGSPAAGGGAPDSSGIAGIFQKIAAFFGFHIQPDTPQTAGTPAKVTKPATAGQQVAEAPQQNRPPNAAIGASRNQAGKAAPTPDTVVQSVLTGVSKIIHSVVH